LEIELIVISLIVHEVWALPNRHCNGVEAVLSISK
jgi:hypothetical protein